jgi:SAM-dependent methyltransferase
VRSTRAWLASFCLCVAAAATFAQAQEDKSFEPYVGLPGKDVIWLPAELVMVDKMMELAKVTPNDVVMDLGSGDGRTVIGAAKRGARGIGVEFNPDMVEHSRRNAEKEGVASRVTFERGDLFETDLSRATVITLFLLPSINLKLRPKLLDLKPGTRIVGNTFTMEDWQPDETVRDESKGQGCGFNCVAYLWVIPAKVAGTWQVPQGELKLEQNFQILSGTVHNGEESIPVTGKLLGNRLTLSGRGVEYGGLVNGNTIEGTMKTGATSSVFKAIRK